jgi:hypothetical protein
VRVLTIIIGLVLIAGGILLVYRWPDEVLFLIKGAVALGLIFVGLGAFFFGMSEIRSAGEEARAAAQAPPPPPAPEAQKPEGES